MTTPIILGIDEVGRGPWAGPLVVGAVVLGPDFQSTQHDLWQTLTDSKQLTAKKRQTLSQPIVDYAGATGLGWVTAAELDQYGLSASLKLATRRAVEQILASQVVFSEIIIDGTVNFLQNTPLTDRVTLLKKADLLIKEVSAASIIAKVARDNYMIKIAQKYPGYGFEKHVGYGTATHKQALLEQGICPEHRTSFKPIQAIIVQNHTHVSQDHTSQTQNHAHAPQDYANETQNHTHGKNTDFTEVNQNTQKHTSSPTSHTSSLRNYIPNTTSRGHHAEELVAAYLTSQNHTIIAQNYKTKTYEIDLISTKDHKIYFTEVKYRKNITHGSALAQITPTKLQQMHYAANKFLGTHPEFQTLQPLLAAASVEDGNYQIKDWLILDE